MSLSPRNKRLFYEEMAKLLEAGFDIRKAADVLDTPRLPRSQRVLLNNLREGLNGGGTIAESFGRDTHTISELEKNIITAGERGGKLGRSFQHLADYFAMISSARSEMIKGSIYPIIILHMGVSVGTVPLAVMQGVKTRGEIAGSFFTTLLGIYILCLLLFFLGRMIWNTAPGSPLVDSLINRIPWIGKARRNMAMSRFCKVYHACLLAGISMRETVRVASKAAQSGLIRKAGANLEAVAKEGNALGPGFMRERAFPPEFARSYAAGEEAGTLDRDMANWSARFQEQAESTMKHASVMIPKLLYFLMLMFIAWKIIGFFTGYYAELDGLLE